MQIPLISGIEATEAADFSEVYPTNLEPVSIPNGISQGYLRTAYGATTISTGPGVSRGGTTWNGVHYRVMGTKLVSVDQYGTITILGDVGGIGAVSFARGFDRVAIRSGVNLFYWNGTTLTKVTDPDMGQCLDVAWLNGQFFTTDGTDILAADIDDPTNFTATRYGAAEADPDPITGLIVSRNEMYVGGGNTIEVQSYTGGANFPLSSNVGATIPRGIVGPMAKCLYSESFAFVGAGKNEQPGVYIQNGGSALKLSTRAIDKMLAAVTDLTTIEMETRVSDDEERLLIHLPDRTLVYLYRTSQMTQDKNWYVVRSGRAMDKAYRLRHAVLAYGKFWVGDTESGALGTLTDTSGAHFGEVTGWAFQTALQYNKGASFIVHQMELVGLYGRGVTAPASAFMSWSKDGETWSMEKPNKLPALGSRTRRITWSPHSRFRNYMALRFRGDSNSLVGIAALNVPDDQIEALAA